MRRQILLLGMIIAASVCHAQQDSTRVKMASHYLGIQANELIRQLFNLSGNSSTIVNPYLINYAVNSNKSGWGLNLGVGYTINNTTSQTDANNSSKTQANNFSLRIGVERKLSLSKKWMMSYGLDFLLDNNETTTTNTSQFQFNNDVTVIDATTKDSGLGPRFTLNYFITPKIILGTEITYYYKAINVTQKNTDTSTTSTVDPITGQQTSTFNTTTSNSTQTLKQLNFAVPALLFLIMKL